MGVHDRYGQDESGPLFRDRIDAGRVLAERLEAFRGQGTVVLGIPRGGVPVAAEVARRLDARLDVIVARKLPAPRSPEFAIGAVTANGGRYLNEDALRAAGVSQPYLDAIIATEMAEARDREQHYRSLGPAVPLAGQVVVIVDDGLATGATMRAAARSVRQHGPARLVLAAPVGSAEACDALREEADEVICPHRPRAFGAVGFYYEYFEPTEDVQVRGLLDEARERAAGVALGSR